MLERYLRCRSINWARLVLTELLLTASSQISFCYRSLSLYIPVHHSKLSHVNKKHRSFHMRAAVSRDETRELTKRRSANDRLSARAVGEGVQTTYIERSPQPLITSASIFAAAGRSWKTEQPQHLLWLLTNPNRMQTQDERRRRRRRRRRKDSQFRDSSAHTRRRQY